MSHDGHTGLKRVGCDSTLASIHRMVQINVSGGALTASNREDLCELNSKLMRIKGFGGAYEAIGFSPDVEALMRRAGIGEKVGT